MALKDRNIIYHPYPSFSFIIKSNFSTLKKNPIILFNLSTLSIKLLLLASFRKLFIFSSNKSEPSS